jgi:beta-N-acetylhexosaminidase
MKYLFHILLILAGLVNFSYTQAQTGANKTESAGKMQSPSQRWVDSVYNSLNEEQRIGQLFMLAAYSGGEKYNRSFIENAIKNNYIGGLIFMQGTAEAQAEQTNVYQGISKVPLMIAMDAEWGLGMRLKNVDDLPRQIMMGAMNDSSIAYKYGKVVAKQCKRLGVHVNFAPVVDINNNPDNPVINFRSFGENKFDVVKFATMYMKGMQDNRVLACAKHFPGHGNTNTDSHKDLPEINGSQSSLENLELYPFRELINHGIGSMMIAHLQVPALDNTPNLPTTLSKKVVTDLLKKKYSYKGLIFTDALNMQGVAKYYKPGEVDLKAFLAGNDVLLFSEDVPKGVAKIKASMAAGDITDERLAESVKKILLAKYLLGVHEKKIIDATNITADINKYTSSTRTEIARAALTLARDNNNILSKIKSKQGKIAYVQIGGTAQNAMSNSLAAYGITENYLNPGNAVLQNLSSYNAVIVSVQGLSPYPGKNFGISAAQMENINSLIKNKNAALVLFGNPYAMKYFCNSGTTLVCYDEKNETQRVAADIVTGKIKAKGKLPVSICNNYKAGDGIVSNEPNAEVVPDLDNDPKPKTASDIETPNIKKKEPISNEQQLQVVPKPSQPVNLTCCVNPASIGANTAALSKIDDLMNDAIAKGAMPGARILVSKDGKIFFDKSYGHLTYDKSKAVQTNTVYDVASVTKIAATTLAIMKLYEDGKIDLDAYVGKYVKRLQGTDKGYLKIKDILLHQAGLVSWIPFYKETLDSNKDLRADIYASKESNLYSIKVAPNVYMKKQWTDTMWQRMIASELGPTRYEYSDLDFIFLQKVVEGASGESLEKYVTKHFYIPMGLKSTMFTPAQKLRLKVADIAPSENDDYFRNQQLQGYVHDMGAAMFGGVSGHAGLFSTANDLGVIMQMLLNGGFYNGKRLLNKRTVDLFTSYHSTSRRGYGFDKPEQAANKNTPVADACSKLTFGHQGFTGTCVWADPATNMVFVFLSNRTYPSAENKLISRMDLRSRAQQYAYEAFGLH